LAPTTTRPTVSGETWSPTSAPTAAPTTSEPTTSEPTTAPTTQCPADLASFCPTADCYAGLPAGPAIRYNCQRTCDSCRTAEVIALTANAASGLSQTEGGAPSFFITATFDADFNALSSFDRASLQMRLKSAFCDRIAAAGVACDKADLQLTLSARSRRSARRSASTTIATVTLPMGTTQAQATAISNDIALNPITVAGIIDGTLISSIYTVVTFETSSAASPDAEATADRTSKIVTAVLAAVLAVAVLGAAFVLNARSTSYQLEKTNAAQDLGWDHSAEAASEESKRATVWHQEGSADGAHFFPEGELAASFEPVILGNSFGSSESPPQTAEPAHFYPLASRLR